MNCLTPTKKMTKFECPNCDKKLANKYTLLRHMETKCGINKSEIDKTRLYQRAYKIIDQIDDQEVLETLRQKIEIKLNIPPKKTNELNMDNSDNNTVAIGNINTTINPIININIDASINNLGEENLEKIFENSKALLDKLKFIETGYRIKKEKSDSDSEEDSPVYSIEQTQIKSLLIQLFRLIHCSEDSPENHNIYVSTKKSWESYFLRIDNKWQDYHSIDGFDDIINHIQSSLINLIEHKTKSVNTKKQQRYYKTLRDTIESECQTLLENSKQHMSIRKSMYLEAYQHRDLIKKTFNATRKEEST